MARMLSALAFVVLLSGCLSVMRVPFPHHEKYSDGGVCTNRQWAVAMDDPGFREKCWTVYPTIFVRCYATKMVFSPIDYTKTGEALYKEKHKYWTAIPLTVLWLTSPLDAVVDTVFLPFDLCNDDPTETKEKK